MDVRQKHDERLWSYINRFKKEELEVRDVDPMVSMNTTINGLLSVSAFKCSVAKTPPRSKAEFLKKAHKYIAVEEALVGDCQEEEADHHCGGPKKKRRSRDNRNDNNNNNSKDSEKLLASALAYRKYTPLNSTRTQILKQVEKEEYMKWPKKMKRNPKRGNPKKYCKYHHSTGHDTEDCYELKNEIESLIHHGHLKQYMGGKAGASSSQQQQLAGVIDVIIGCSALARKAYARQLNIQRLALKKLKQDEALTFTDEDLKGILVPHDDVLVVFSIVMNFLVKRILVDSGSFTNILFYDAYEKMKLAPERLESADVPLVGFSRNVVRLEGEITLPVMVGAKPR
ncbi:PREDICTED: uncharacterized protein LOC104590279 [Nelumbo nucifera]|uniref:Uncharacterized protein LOC104590279 n=1 Tax=Nelumbo nucifera TaxID=4432 RepID=A0A1U7ZGD6_NELNU|nr:PREDICTED: uncharacterized protein LOC104590279 [Nelumbo nucifera]